MKLTDFHKAHLPESIAQDLERDAPAYEGTVVCSTRGVVRLKYPHWERYPHLERMYTTYYYRGTLIIRNSGYRPEWLVGGFSRSGRILWGIEEAKAYIDASKDSPSV